MAVKNKPGTPIALLLLHYRSILLRLAMILIGFSFCYYAVFIELSRQWSATSTYSFGYIVPLVSLYLIWEKRARLAQLAISPALVPGFLLLGFSMLLFLMGKFGGVLLLQEISILITLPAVLLIVFGEKATKALAFPLSYLIFMLPAWDFPIEKVQHPFQLLSARVGGWLLPVFGVPAYQHGIYIDIPNLSIEVSKACSGVNFLISILAIGIPVAALHFDSWWKRSLLLLVSVLVAISGNGLRAALICFFYYKGYSTNLYGPGHMFYGYFVSVLGLLVLFMGVYLFGKPTDSGMVVAETGNAGARAGAYRHDIRWAWVVATTLLFFAAGFAANNRTPRPTPLKYDLRDFPNTIGDYAGMDRSPVLEGLAGNGADAELSRAYTDGRNGNYQLYVGYYAFQEQKKKVTNYRTRGLFRNSKTYLLPTSLSAEGKINGFVADIKGGKRLVLYWYDVDGNIVLNPYSVILRTAVSGMVRNRTNSAIVAITTDYDPDSDVPSQIRRHSGFVKEVAILFGKYLES